MSIEEEVEHLVYAQCAQFIEVVNCDANGGIHIMIYYIRYRYIDEKKKIYKSRRMRLWVKCLELPSCPPGPSGISGP